MLRLSETIERKFTETIDLSDWEIETEEGWKDVSSVSKTIPYEVYYLKTNFGKELKSADTHIIFGENGNELFVKDSLNKNIITKDGIETVTEVYPLGYEEEMYDLDVDSNNHSYYSNDILSHNSITVGSYSLYSACFTPDYQVGIASNKMDSAKDIMERIKFIYENMPHFLKPAVREYNKFSIMFDNGSSIETATTTENTFRGRSKNLILLDEFAFIQKNVADSFWASLLPTISAEGENSSTKLIIISTPNGSDNLFSHLWFGAVNEENGFFPVTIDPYEVPGRTQEWRESMIKKMGKLKYQQEFELHFINTNNTLIDPVAIESTKYKDPVSEYRRIRFFVDSFKDRKLFISIDPSEGSNNDDHAIEIIDIETFEQVGEYNNNEITQSMLVSLFLDLLKHLYDNGSEQIYYMIENNGVGIGIINLLSHADNEYLLKASSVNVGGKIGHTTSAKTKSRGAMLFKDLLETKRLTIHSKFLINQLKYFSKKGNTYKAEVGYKDDLIMAILIAVNGIDKIKIFEEGTYDVLTELPQFGNENDMACPIFF